MKYLLFGLVLLPAFAQQIPPRSVLPQLREYLQLSNAQVYALLVNADDYNRKASEKMQRIRQVQMELTDETSAPNPSSAALAVRYLEVELICRELKDYALVLRAQNLEILTDQQKARIKAIEEAMKLLPAFSETQSANLTGAWIAPPAGFNLNSYTSPFSLQFFGGQGPVQGCAGTAMLTGVFQNPALQP